VCECRFFVKHFTLYGPLMGAWGAFWFYMAVRTLESHWFTWVTQMNHIPMNVDTDRELDWPTLQGLATCNVEGGLFNDWFTGHLNYQIEHHLFPTMPRHNYPVANKKVQALYKKHGVPMQTKGLIEAFGDIIKSLEHYGQVWKDAYYD
jgi:fatty acid desaturase